MHTRGQAHPPSRVAMSCVSASSRGQRRHHFYCATDSEARQLKWEGGRVCSIGSPLSSDSGDPPPPPQPQAQHTSKQSGCESRASFAALLPVEGRMAAGCAVLGTPAAQHSTALASPRSGLRGCKGRSSTGAELQLLLLLLAAAKSLKGRVTSRRVITLTGARARRRGRHDHRLHRREAHRRQRAQAPPPPRTRPWRAGLRGR